MKHLAVILVIAAVASVGCSKRPTDAINTANEAMKKAYHAKTHMYAPLTTKKALALYQKAQTICEEQDKKFALFRSYAEAKWTYEDAAKLFDSATMSNDYVDTSAEHIMQYLIDKIGVTTAP